MSSIHPIFTGIDIVSIPRIYRIIKIHGALFAKKILTQDEYVAMSCHFDFDLSLFLSECLYNLSGSEYIANISQVESGIDEYENNKDCHNINQNVNQNKNKIITRVSYYLAKKFAAKESYVKALGVGISKDIGFQDIEITKDNFGKPYYGEKTKFIDGFYHSLSISDEYPFAIASVILTRK